jgi:hypothetical protein
MVAAPYKKHQSIKFSGCSTRITVTGVKLGAKQLNIIRIGCRTTQHFWIQSLIKKNKIKFSSPHFSPKK